MKQLYQILICILIKISSFSLCSQEINNQNNTGNQNSKTTKYVEFPRDSIINKLKWKIEDYQALVIHVFMPLCDSKNQGIVKVGGKLGEGRNLKTNLYWGAGYGLKTWFTRSSDWKCLQDIVNLDSSILERVVCSRIYSSKAKVYLILDAYAGDRMDECIENYFKSLAGSLSEVVTLDSIRIPIFSKSDFLIFNGHNGLMDKEYKVYANKDNVEKDAAVISCGSYNYFVNRLKFLKAYPLITTTSLLPPEAYVISAIIDSWATMQPDYRIRMAAGEAMASVHKLSVKPCVNMFHTGW